MGPTEGVTPSLAMADGISATDDTTDDRQAQALDERSTFASLAWASTRPSARSGKSPNQITGTPASMPRLDASKHLWGRRLSSLDEEGFRRSLAYLQHRICARRPGEGRPADAVVPTTLRARSALLVSDSKAPGLTPKLRSSGLSIPGRARRPPPPPIRG